MENKENKKTIGYVRCSTDRQDCSQQVQEQKIREYCSLKGIILDELLIDIGVSGKTPLYDRPEGSKLKNAKPNNIIAIKLDRIFRNTVDALQTIELWNKQNINIHIIDMGGTSIDTRTAIGKMFITMISGFNSFERCMIAERTSAALQQKKANLEKYGRIPYGFKQIINTEKDGKFKIVKNGEMPIIERIFEMRKTTTYDGIAETLNRENVPTKNNKRWYASTIRYILKNSIYACLAILLMFQAQAQELPELNKKILHYADSVMGKHIGKGLCRNFVNKALEYTDKYSIDKKANGDPATLLLWLGGFRVLPENALPGDIICNSQHVGIIYSLEYDFPFCYCEGRCLTIVHQQADGKKTSFVQTGHYCLEKTSYWYYLRP